MNNYEKIKAMSIDEMVRWLWRITDCECCEASKKDCCFGAGKCEKTLKQWLQQENEGCE